MINVCKFMPAPILAVVGFCIQPALADENLFGYISGAETLPKGANEAYTRLTYRDDKGIGDYHAFDVEAEYERGITSRLTGTLALQGLSIDTEDILIDAYIPGDKDYGLKPSGVEGRLKYMFLSPAKDIIGLSSRVTLEYQWLDMHSGQDKDTTSFTTDMQLQKNFLDDQLVTVANVGLEATYAKRHSISNLPPGFEWPTDPEMEIEFAAGGGIMYRFAPRWFLGAETIYETEWETEVGQERWSLFAGPTLHYASNVWWTTLTWLPQIVGGGPPYPGQTDDLQLIEKTKQEIRFQIGFNF